MSIPEQNLVQQFASGTKSQRPRFLRDVETIALDDGVAIDGLGPLKVIRGPIAQTILPDLLRLLDGTRTVGELEETFSMVPPDYLRTAISLLEQWGMIEHNVDQSVIDEENSGTLAFLRRCIAKYKLDSSAADARKRLSDATVLIVTSEETEAEADALRLLLEATDIKSVRVIERNLYREILRSSSLVIALSQTQEDIEWYTELEQSKNGVGFSWLRAVLSPDTTSADIGPLFVPGTETCYSCFRHVHTRYSRDAREVPRDDLSLRKTWASFVALEITQFLALPRLALTNRIFRRFRLPDWDSRILNYPRLPGCQQCNRHPLHLAAPQIDNVHLSYTDTAIVYENYVSLDSRDATIPSTNVNSAHTNAGANAKSFPNCKQIPLYRGDLKLEQGIFDALGKESFDGCSITLNRLSAILALTAGIREVAETATRRWAATAGNLGSVELFVVSHQVEGLDPGFYFYQALDHTLASFRKRSALDVDEFMCRVLGTEHELPDALILFTGSFDRVSEKYGSFGYRLIHLDAGVAVSQLQLVTRSMNVCARMLPSQADNLIQTQFNLRPYGEQPTALIELSRRLHRQRKSSIFFEHIQAPLQPHRSCKPAYCFSDLDLSQITELLMSESLTADTEAQYSDWIVSRDLIVSKNQRTPGIRLPKPAREGRLSVGDVLAERRSIRTYAERAVHVSEIGTALYYAQLADASEWPDELSLTYVVLANHVIGIEQGVYEYNATKHALSKREKQLSPNDISELLVQREFADVPVLVWIFGNLVAACARHGANGHRKLLLRAGAAGHKLWMASLGLGLSGCMIAGLVPGAARRLLGIDGYKMASLIALSIGYQPQ